MSAGAGGRPFATIRIEDCYVLALGFFLVIASLLLTFTDPSMPRSDLDTAWGMASEYAVSHGYVFGRDFVFNFGPYSVLSTRLFSATTWRLVLTFDVLSVLAVFWTALANRSVVALLALWLCFLVLRLPSDALSPLALFGMFLVALQRRQPWAAVAFFALSGPIVLSKLSYGLVLFPLALLADAERLIARKLPYVTATCVGSAVCAYAIIKQPLDSFSIFIANSIDLILGYGRAMQIHGPDLELIFSLVFAAAAVIIVATYALKYSRESKHKDFRPWVIMLGFVWFMFALFKMAFVRQDGHTIIFHLAAPAALAMSIGFLDLPDNRRPVRNLTFAVVLAIALSTSFYWRSINISHFTTDPAIRPHRMEGAALGTDAGRVLTRLPPRLGTGWKWLSGGGMREAENERRVRLAALARPFPTSVVGTVDVIPWNLAPVIASGLSYSPRPVPQSYQANTPRLQRLDKAHFAGPDAPDTVLLRIEDIDNRLPSLALGPSLPVIGQRYDAVGTDPLGLILRKRKAPRSMSVRATGEQAIDLGGWVRTPVSRNSLVVAHIHIDRSLPGQLIAFLFREPVLTISLETASGRELEYRFVPGMAEEGVGVSPLPRQWTYGAPALLDPAWASTGEPVTALRVMAKDAGWAFRGGRVRYDIIEFEPGFASALDARVAGDGVGAGR